jgi:hypothetical protein
MSKIKFEKCVPTMLVVTCLMLSVGTSGTSLPVEANSAQQPPPRVKLQTMPDGFAGTCEAEEGVVTLEAHLLDDGSSISRIRHSDGRLLVETELKGNNLEFRFANVKLAMDLGSQTLIGIAEKDEKKLQAFLQSSDATLARKCIVPLIQSLKQNKDILKRNEGQNIKNTVPLVVMFTSMLLADKHPLPQPTVTPQPEAASLRR